MKKEVIKGIEIHDDQPQVDPISTEKGLAQLAAEESFLNEIVTVMIHPTTNENDAPHVIVNVNGINQPIIRGYPTEVRRKYVEVLARMKETKYSQPGRDMSNPEHGNQVIGRTALSYPFEVMEDKNPRGRAWLQHVLAEPA